MKIGIDISQIVYGTGVSNYTRNLVENLLKADKENNYMLLFSSLRRNIKNQKLKIKNTNQKSKIKKYRFPPLLFDFLWNRFHVLPIEKLIGQVDVFHSSDWAEPPARCPKVTTIHDLTPLIFPKETHPKIVAVHKRKLEWVKRESKLIIAVSESTKQDIVNLLRIPEEKIRVVYEAASENFQFPISNFQINKIKRKYGIKGNYLLAFGGPPRKNLERLLEAFSHITYRLSHITLVIIGNPPNTTYYIPHTTYLGYIPQQDLPALYSNASCLVYPSLYEGFGLPILEAMACGCPVVTSNISSMPEVAGKAAVLVNPLSVEDIAKGIKKAIERREEMVKKGFERVKFFSWEKCAKETLRVYKEAVAL